MNFTKLESLSVWSFSREGETSRIGPEGRKYEDPTPTTAFENAVFDAPLPSSSASQRGIQQTHEEVDQRIVEELNASGRMLKSQV
jgi:hypothetical protein